MCQFLFRGNAYVQVILFLHSISLALLIAAALKSSSSLRDEIEVGEANLDLAEAIQFLPENKEDWIASSHHSSKTRNELLAMTTLPGFINVMSDQALQKRTLSRLSKRPLNPALTIMSEG